MSGTIPPCQGLQAWPSARGGKRKWSSEETFEDLRARLDILQAQFDAMQALHNSVARVVALELDLHPESTLFVVARDLPQRLRGRRRQLEECQAALQTNATVSSSVRREVDALVRPALLRVHPDKLCGADRDVLRERLAATMQTLLSIRTQARRLL